MCAFFVAESSSLKILNMTLCNAGSKLLGMGLSCNLKNAFLWAVLTTAIRQTLSHVTFASLSLSGPRKQDSVEAGFSQRL